MPGPSLDVIAFAGRWIFSPEQSSLSTPSPASWIQNITVNDDFLRVEEIITRADGTVTAQTVEARIDGTPYAVNGSPLLDAIAYSALGEHVLQGIGTSNGAPLLHETVRVAPDRSSLTQEFKIEIQSKTVASGTAVFLPDTSSR